VPVPLYFNGIYYIRVLGYFLYNLCTRVQLCIPVAYDTRLNRQYALWSQTTPASRKSRGITKMYTLKKTRFVVAEVVYVYTRTDSTLYVILGTLYVILVLLYLYCTSTGTGTQLIITSRYCDTTGPLWRLIQWYSYHICTCTVLVRSSTPGDLE